MMPTFLLPSLLETTDIGQAGIFWQGIHKPLWTTHDLLAAHLLYIPEEVIDQHKRWDDDQCELGPDCRYCGTLPT